MSLPRPVAGSGSTDDSPIVVERAVGLLAGRARCRLADAHRHLVRMAAERQCDVADVAGRVTRLLDSAVELADRPTPETVPQLVAAALAEPGTGRGRRPGRRSRRWLTTVQAILDAMPGMAGYFTPVRDRSGRLTDLVWAAATPEAITPDGRRGAHLVGLAVSRLDPQAVAADHWDTYRRVLDTGAPADVGPLRRGGADYVARVRALGPGLLLSWQRCADPGRELARVSGMEQLGNLGWGEWDVVSGTHFWSPQVYRIYERDPELGPLSQEDLDALVIAEDLPLRDAAVQAFSRAERVDLIYRVRVGSRIKHVRTVADAVRDAEGRPLRVFGIVQDVTEQQTGAARLAEVERQLDEQRRTLAAEHDLAGRLQRIILPIPDRPLELPGLRAAVRYLPAGEETAVGGDWYHAAALRDGSVLLAVGDVAGHGTPAAKTMAQLRHALRALAVITSDPRVLLDHLNQLMCELERETPELAATAVIARFDPHRQELLWAQAGHPPPLLSRGGCTVPLGRPSGPMLGVVDDATYGAVVTDFHPDDVLLLYTDGLVEHRGRSMDAGLDAVIATVDAATRAAPDQPLGELLGRLHRANPDDDTCILAARALTGAPCLARHPSISGAALLS